MTLREAREDAKLSQMALAKRAGVSRSTIINYERGHRVPRIPELKKICDALGVSVSEMVCGL